MAFPFHRDTVFLRVGRELNKFNTVVTDVNLNICLGVVQGAFTRVILRLPENRYHLLSTVTEANSTFAKRQCELSAFMREQRY